MTIYLLDTNTISDVVRHNAFVTRRLLSRPIGDLRVSCLTEGELLFGLAMRPNARSVAAAAMDLLGRIDIVPWDGAAAKAYGPFRARLQRSGRALAPLDMLIAAHAISLGAVLVTADKALLALDDLDVENWRDPFLQGDE